MTSYFLYLLSLTISFLLVQLSLLAIPKLDAISLAIAPPKIISQFNFGFSHLMADLLWVRWLQSIDLCTQSGGFNEEVFNTTKKTLDPKQNIGKCELGWSYQMLDRITDLNPDLQIAYRVGITSLSVFVKDYKGGSLLIEKAMRRYPKNWIMAYRGAYHYMFEDINPDRAAELLFIAAKNGGPIWLASLAAKLNMEQSKDEFALKYLLEIREQFPDSEHQVGIERRIAEIKKRLNSRKK